MKHFLFILFFCHYFCYGQDFKTEFDTYCQLKDTAKQIELLKKWEIKEPKNPELFTSYFNHYFLKSKQEALSITTQKPNGDSFSIQDSSGNTTSYIGSTVYFNSEMLQKSFEKIDQGILLYPNRLDMRFGKIYALGLTKDWQQFTNEIIKTIQYSKLNNNEWTWTYDKKKDDGRAFFLSSLQDYQLSLYNTGRDDLLINMKMIANEVLKFYPDHVESLSNLSIVYLLTGKLEEGLEVLLRAEKIAPKDEIVLGNIAQYYLRRGDKKMAIHYYEKVIEFGDERSVNFARQQLEELKK